MGQYLCELDWIAVNLGLLLIISNVQSEFLIIFFLRVQAIVFYCCEKVHNLRGESVWIFFYFLVKYLYL